MKPIHSFIRRLVRISMIFIISFLFAAHASAQCSASFTYATDPSNNGDVSFTNASSSGTGLYYTWTFGDGTSDNSTHPLHHYMYTGTYTVCVSVYDSLGLYDSTLGCYGNYCIPINVINTTTAPCVASFSYDTSGYFNNTSSGPYSISYWSFGDGTNDTTGAWGTSHTFATPGMYVVSLSITDSAGGCSSSYWDTLNVGPPPCYAYFSSMGSTDTVVFNNYSYGGSGPLTYFWDFGDGATSTLASPVHVYTSDGTYNVCLSISDGTCSNMTCAAVYIGPPVSSCDASFTLVVDSASIYSVYVYMNTTPPSGSYTSYFWDFGDGSSSTLQYPTHTYASSGPYFLCLTVADSAMGIMCTDTYCDSIDAGLAMAAPLTMTVLPGSPVGVEEAAIITSLETYPNPFSGNTTITYTIAKEASVELQIMNLIGEKVAGLENGTQAAGVHTLRWNAEALSEGMYLLQLRVNNDFSTRKMIISK